MQLECVLSVLAKIAANLDMYRNFFAILVLINLATLRKLVVAPPPSAVTFLMDRRRPRLRFLAFVAQALLPVLIASI